MSPPRSKAKRSRSRWATAAIACGAWPKNISHELLQVNVLVSARTCAASGFHVDTLDLYAARQRAAFTKQAAEELGVKEEVIRRDLGRVLLKLEELQDEQIQKALETAGRPRSRSRRKRKRRRWSCCAIPSLLERILADFERCGVVGEETNKLVGYLAAVSRIWKRRWPCSCSRAPPRARAR